METVLTLVARDRLETVTVDAARFALRRAGASLSRPDWLAPGTACDLSIDGLDPKAAEGLARRSLGDAAVDLAAQPSRGRRKRVLVADMESTVIVNEMLDELAEAAGVRPQVERLTALAMNGELDFRDAVCRRVAFLKGLETAVIKRALERVEVDPGAPALVATMAAGGAFTVLVSGGFGCFAEPVARRLGFHSWQANELEVAGGRLTGRVAEPMLCRDGKLRVLEHLCRELGLVHREAAAVGDGANDLPMLEAAGLGVAYRAKPSVAAAARFAVRHGDLETLLYFQGYGADEIARGALSP